MVRNQPRRTRMNRTLPGRYLVIILASDASRPRPSLGALPVHRRSAAVPPAPRRIVFGCVKPSTRF
jgi:hypothetical protein